MAVSTGLLHRLRAVPFPAVRDVAHLLFSKYLLVTNTTVACGLAGVGDILTQHYEKLRHVRKDLCRMRTRNQCIQVVIPELFSCHTSLCASLTLFSSLLKCLYNGKNKFLLLIM